MVGRGLSNSDLTHRAIHRARRIGLRLSPNPQDREGFQRTQSRTPTTRQRDTMGNSQPQNHLDSCDSSDGSDEGNVMDDASEESVEIFRGRPYEGEHSNVSLHRREKRKDMPSLDHEVAHITKLRSAPNGMLSRIYGENKKGYIRTFSMLAGREANVSGRGKFSSADCCHVSSRYLPTGDPVIMDKMNSRAYVGRFSTDGSLFVAGFQDRRIKIYNVDKGWKLQKDVLARSLRWTITDTALSPDQRFLVYATITPVVHIVNVGNSGTESLANITEIHEGLDFSVDATGEYSFGLFCVKFSTDGRELVAGSSDKSIYVYDLEANKLALQIAAHKDDVNTVAFADETGHLIYSGSDDSYCKVWDRRCLTSRARPAGSLAGHLEGITFIDSRGDGRYFISNGKDQTIKLWDIRKMTSGNPTPRSKKVPSFTWDYRRMEYPGARRDIKHPYDQSLMTYRGHAVLRTLIRCYFSPAFSTGQKYIYTGSHDGCVHIYDVVTGQRVAKLDYHSSTVRDCSWHPLYPTLVSSSWDGVVAKWDYPTAADAKSSQK
uniref:LEC14B homolog n=1 Tax=Wollemia nobilis TaxID=56998 RepID=A0A0C9S975_9CONI